MPAGLASLPFDILYWISQYLTLEEAVHVGLTCQQLSAVVLREPTLCHRIVEGSAKYSEEAALIRDGGLRVETALYQLYRRRAAVRRGEPYHVQTVAKAQTFVYSKNVLCTLLNDIVTVRRFGGHGLPEHSFRFSALFEQLAGFGYPDAYTVRLLDLNSDVLAIVLQAKEGSVEDDLLAALKFCPAGSFQLLFVRHLESASELFVRQDSRRLFYGTHTGLGDRNHHEWIIQSVDLIHPEDQSSDHKVQLLGFVGSELGGTVDFKVHDGYFYAVSNQTSFTVEEVDWTSFYSVFRFPVDSACKEKVEINRNIYRRQHLEGPIHDSWTSLSLQHDEQSNLLYIIESRREWLEGGSKQTRTFYKELIWFDEPSSPLDDLSPNASPTSTRPLMPEDDLFSSVVTSDMRPRWAPYQSRSPDQVHPEYGNASDPAPSFIVAKTRLRTYNMSCAAFLDLVEDTRCCAPASSCLRLRIGCRQPSPLQQVVGACGAPGRAAEGKMPVRDPYRYSNIKLWPPVRGSCDGESGGGAAHDAMNPHLRGPDAPPAYLGLQVSGVSDERCVVYMAKPARPRCEADRVGTVVLVSFDPAALGDGSDVEQRGGWSREAVPWPRCYAG